MLELGVLLATSAVLVALGEFLSFQGPGSLSCSRHISLTFFEGFSLEAQGILWKFRITKLPSQEASSIVQPFSRYSPY